MDFDIIVIGAGLSGLTAASLLSKRGLKVAVFDKSYNPGGSCGTFKRNGVTFDQGSAMLYGFGQEGFNPHRFVFNCIEAPISVLRHDLLYCVNYKGKRIRFWADIDRFAEELGEVFPGERENIRKFYHDFYKLYRNVMMESPAYSTPDEADRQTSLAGILRHPLSYLKFFSLMNKNTRYILERYFKDPEIFQFFNKLTSTYCYTTVDETPGILAAVMFIDNHVGGSYYPAGSTVYLPGKLEKVIEENGGELFMETQVKRILFEGGKPIGVETEHGRQYKAQEIIYSGTVWNLYGGIIAPEDAPPQRVRWAESQVPTFPSVVLYAQVDASVIPDDTAPIEMLVGNPDKIDEGEITVYLLSIDDHTLCEENSHVIAAIGPSLTDWNETDPSDYRMKKENEKKRICEALEKRFPGFKNAIRYWKIATPKTIERYTMKNGGAVAGPKQMLGQHMLRRLHTRTEWDSLFCCGESTVMGTGTPAVTVSGVAAANSILKKRKLPLYLYESGKNEYVHIHEKPYNFTMLMESFPEEKRAIVQKAFGCENCEKAGCMKNSSLDVRGIMRRIIVGNFFGAKRIVERYYRNGGTDRELKFCEQGCLKHQTLEPIPIADMVKELKTEIL